MFELEGTLVERPVNIGDEGEAGQLVAELDQRDFRARVKATEAELTTRAASFEHAKELVQKDFIAKTE